MLRRRLTISTQPTTTSATEAANGKLPCRTNWPNSTSAIITAQVKSRWAIRKRSLFSFGTWARRSLESGRPFPVSQVQNPWPGRWA